MDYKLINDKGSVVDELKQTIQGNGHFLARTYKEGTFVPGKYSPVWQVRGRELKVNDKINVIANEN